MSIQYCRDSYDNISQRAVATLAKGLIPLEPIEPADPLAASQRDLHAFFTALYAIMYEQPKRFGMPTTPDDALGSEKEGKERKQEVTRKLKKAWDIIDITIALLREWGMQGRIDGERLVIDEAAYRALSEAKSKAKKGILAGMSEAGLAVEAADGAVALRNTRYPKMMLALRAMAEGCAQEGDERWGASAFARCDFKTLAPGYQLDPVSLLGYFAPEDRARAIELHQYLLDTGHQPLCRANNPHVWDIQYQGSRKIKGTPLMQIDYSERFINPMRVFVKCAAAGRLTPSFSEQPPAVQVDFRNRVNRCNGAACGWCKDKKGLNPSVLEYGGEKLAVCWYTRRDIDQFTDETMEILRGYVRWHQALV